MVICKNWKQLLPLRFAVENLSGVYCFMCLDVCIWIFVLHVMLFVHYKQSNGGFKGKCMIYVDVFLGFGNKLNKRHPYCHGKKVTYNKEIIRYYFAY